MPLRSGATYLYKESANSANGANEVEYMYAFKPIQIEDDEEEESIVAQGTYVDLTRENSQNKETDEISKRVQMLRDAKHTDNHEKLNIEFKQHLRALLTTFHEGPFSDSDREMHQIRTLIELFEFLNEPKYEKVLMDARNFQFRHTMLTRCKTYQNDARTIIGRRIVALRNAAFNTPDTNNDLMHQALNAGAYYTFYLEELCEKTDAFYHHYCNKL